MGKASITVVCPWGWKMSNDHINKPGIKTNACTCECHLNLRQPLCCFSNKGGPNYFNVVLKLSLVTYCTVVVLATECLLPQQLYFKNNL